MSNLHTFQFQKERTALKFYLIGRGYAIALKSLGFAERYHVGLRKDGKTPAFHHQIRIAFAVTQLKGLLNEELCIAGALLHDVQEDYQIPTEVIREEFGPRVAEIVWKLTKKFGDEHKRQEDYIRDVSLDPDASIVKGLDRCDNIESMPGAFSHAKMREYAAEAELIFLTMLKKASKLFPEQQAAYEAIRQRLKTGIRLAREIVDVVVAEKLQSEGLFEELERATNRAASLKGELATAVEGRRVAVEELHDTKNALAKVTYRNFDARQLFLKVYTLLVQNKVPQETTSEILSHLKAELQVSDLELIDFHPHHITGDINL